MKVILVFAAFFSWLNANAQVGEPTTVEPDSVSLWNFDVNTNETISDLAESPVDGTVYGATRVEIPELDNAYGKGLQFSADNQFVDFGITRGSKLDFKGANELTVEAVIRLAGNAPDNHIIFTTDQVQLMIIGNKLGGFIRLSGGFRGVVSETLLAKNTNYRVGLVKSGSVLAITINGFVVNSVDLEGEIVDTSYADARVTIGGNIFGEYFPGYIDDVRVSNSAKVDVVKPSIDLEKPGYTVAVPDPEFEFRLSDNLSGVDSSSVAVYLNGVKQNNLLITESSIVGKMDDPLDSTIINEVLVIVSDHSGNTAKEGFLFSYSSIGTATEYENDEFTLGLWHMEDFAKAVMTDSSSNGKHGYGDPRYHSIGDGVFGKGRYFEGNGNSKITFGSIQVPEKELTVEAWLKPSSNQSSKEEILFHSGQIKVARFNDGQIRVVFYQTRLNEVFETTNQILPVGELHHLGVTWDGTKKEKNLNIFIDGSIVQSFNACIGCDLTPVPQLGIVGEYFNGMMDEIRFSKVVRKTFNVPNNDSRTIEFLTLKNGTSTNLRFPEVHISINSDAGVDPSKVKVYLNGSLQVPGPDLEFTSTSIDGVFNDAAKVGINYVEIEFVDNGGVLKKKSQYFFRIKSSPMAYYPVTPNTVSLYHFEKFAELKDETSNQYDLNGSFELVEGVLGSGIIGGLNAQNVLINGRSFTVESNVRIKEDYNSMYRILGLHGNQFSYDLNLNTSTGDMNFRLYTPDMNVDKTILGVYPLDGKFHHVAAVYDASRGHDQLILLIDGEVKQVVDVNRSCNFEGEHTFYLGTDHVQLDEARLMNIATYDFNIADGAVGPAISLANIQDEATIHQSSINLEVELNSASGISNEGNKILLNGEEVVGLNLTQSGTNATLSGTLSGYLGGANVLDIIARDIDGNESRKTLLFYFFEVGAAQDYAPDEDTIVLLHFNETEGNFFVDSSGNGNDFSFSSGWTLGEPGLFGSLAARTYSASATATVDSLEGVGTYTAELWKRDVYTSSSAYLFDFMNEFNFHLYNNELRVSMPRGGSIYSGHSINPDSLFHHYAFVVDVNQPYRQVYILRDGQVVYSEERAAKDLTIGSSTEIRFGPYFYNDAIEELRFSSKARYILNSLKN